MTTTHYEESQSSSRIIRAIHRHYGDVKYNRTPQQIESEKYLIGSIPFNRWLMFPAAFIFQAICGTLYAWSVYNDLIDGELYGLSAVPNSNPVKMTPNEHRAATTFYIAVGFFGFSSAVNGPWLERNGPRKSAMVGASLFFIGNMLTVIGINFKIIGLIYFGYGVLGGSGLGLCYISPVSALQKWFPDKRGMAAGFAVCGFGAGSIAFAKVPAPLKAAIGLRNCFLLLGCVYFGVMFICALIFRIPPPGFTVNGLDIYRNRVDENGDIEVNQTEKKANEIKDPAHTISLKDAIFSSEYRFIYMMFIGNSVAGLVVLSRLANITTDIFNNKPFADTVVSVNGGFNLLGRLFFSTISDKIGRKNVFVCTLTAQTIILAVLPTIILSKNLTAFVAVIWILTSCYGGGFGCIPAFLCDMFGPSNIGALHGIILTAWSVAGVGGGLIFTAVYDNKLKNNGKDVTDPYIYIYNLYWILGVCALGFIFAQFVRTSIRDRLYPPAKGEITRVRLFGRLIRFGSFGIQFVSKAEEDAVWDDFTQKVLAAERLKEVQSTHVAAGEKSEA